jgi:hypothetical protein
MAPADCNKLVWAIIFCAASPLYRSRITARHKMWPRPYDQALHGAQNPQVLYADGHQAEQRGQHQHNEPDEEWLAPSPGVGEHAMP